MKIFTLTIESISAISLSSQRPRCFNNVILHLNQINKIKNAVVTRNILVSLRPSFSDEGTFSVRALEKPEKQFIDVHEHSGFNHKEKTIRGRVLVVTAVKCCVLVQTENQNKTQLCAYSRIIYNNVK